MYPCKWWRYDEINDQLNMNYKALIEAIVSILKSNIPDERLKLLKAFELRVGVRRQLDISVLNQHFSAFKIENPEFKNVDIEVTIIPSTIQCEWCAMTSTNENNQNVCKFCGKQTEIELTGSEFGIGRLIF